MEVHVAVAGAGRRLAGQVRVTFESVQSDPTKLAQLDVEVTTQLAEPGAPANQQLLWWYLQALRVPDFEVPFRVACVRFPAGSAITQELANVSDYLITSVISFTADTTRVDSDTNAVSSTAPSLSAAFDNDMVIGGMEGMVIGAAAVLLVCGLAVCIRLSVQHACARQKRVHPSGGEAIRSSTSKHLSNSLPGVDLWLSADPDVRAGR
ncbi:ODA11 [Symbiodinium sp. CCMP2456]|nr:ODA11 [Symbiodinium sp. CCMP2456]